jgi:hypothetical protein
MTEPADGVDWTGVTDQMARQIADQGEKFMQAQLQVALAADQRAMTVASVFAAIAAAAIAGSLTYWDKTASAPILVAGLGGGVWMLIGSGICMWAARTVDFYFPGNHPAQWYDGRREDLAAMLGGEAENYQTRIEANAKRLVENGRMLSLGAKFAVSAPLVAIGVWIATLIFS